MTGGLYSSLWGSYIYFNLKIVTKDGDEIRFRDAAGHFIKSPAFQQFAANVADLFGHMRDEGFSSAWEKFIISLDPLGETNALKVNLHSVQLKLDAHDVASFLVIPHLVFY